MKLNDIFQEGLGKFYIIRDPNEPTGKRSVFVDGIRSGEVCIFRDGVEEWIPQDDVLRVADRYGR